MFATWSGAGLFYLLIGFANADDGKANDTHTQLADKFKLDGYSNKYTQRELIDQFKVVMNSLKSNKDKEQMRIILTRWAKGIKSHTNQITKEDYGERQKGYIDGLKKADSKPCKELSIPERILSQSSSYCTDKLDESNKYLYNDSVV